MERLRSLWSGEREMSWLSKLAVTLCLGLAFAAVAYLGSGQWASAGELKGTIPDPIEIVKERPHGQVYATYNFWYYIYITSTLSVPIHDLVVTDTLPYGIAPWSVDVSPGGVFDGVDTVTWTIDTLAPYGSITLWIKAQTHSWASDSYLTNVVCVTTADVGGPYCAVDVAYVKAPPAAPTHTPRPTSTSTPTATPTATSTNTPTVTATATETLAPTATETEFPVVIVYYAYLPIMLKAGP